MVLPRSPRRASTKRWRSAELVPELKAAAKERQREGGRAKAGGKLPQADAGKARDKAAELTGYAARTIDKAEAIVAAAEAERRACEIRLRAERKAGAISKALDRSNPGKRKTDLRGTVPTKSSVLHGAGISVDQAKRWEKLAAVPDEAFERELGTSIEAAEIIAPGARRMDPGAPRSAPGGAWSRPGRAR